MLKKLSLIRSLIQIYTTMTKNLFDTFGQLESLKRESLSKEPEVPLNCYIPKSLRENLKMKAAKEGVPMKNLIINALKGFYTDL